MPQDKELEDELVYYKTGVNSVTSGSAAGVQRTAVLRGMSTARDMAERGEMCGVGSCHVNVRRRRPINRTGTAVAVTPKSQAPDMVGGTLFGAPNASVQPKRKAAGPGGLLQAAS